MNNTTNDIVFTLLGIGFTWEALGIILTFILTVFNLFYGIINSNKALRVNYITDKRVDWIQNVREATVDFISHVYYFTSAKSKDKDSDWFASNIDEMNRKYMTIQLLLNFNGDIDTIIINLLKNILDDLRTRNNKEARKKASLVFKHLRIYLKLEWNRVKREVDKGKYSNKRLRKETLKLYKTYANINNELRKTEAFDLEGTHKLLQEKYKLHLVHSASERIKLLKKNKTT